MALCCIASGSQTVDQKYALKKVAAFVLNGEVNPVYTEAIEKTLTKILDTNGRFEFAETASKENREDWNNTGVATLGRAGHITIPGSLSPRITSLKAKGADSVILAELAKTGESYQLLLAWVTTDAPETVASSEFRIDSRLTVDSFSTATENCWTQLVTSLPYQGSVISREGMRVIIDRGAPEAWKDRIIPAYTLENVDGELNLIETGLIQITDPQDNLSFGKILAENRPFQIELGQKFKFVDPAKFEDHLVLMRPDISRNLASISTEYFTPTRRLGFVDVDMGASFLSVSQLTANGKGASSANMIYPNGGIHGEIWVTRAVFFDAEVSGAIGSVTADTNSPSLQASTMCYQGQIGYRFRLQKTNDPSLYVKAGLYTQTTQVQNQNILVSGIVPSIAYTSTTYSGLLAGAGARFPASEKLAVHFDVNTLIFPSIAETPYTSGATILSASLMQFNLGGTYRLNDAIDLAANLEFFSSGAEFDGQGTRPVPINSIQQTFQTFKVGARYYF